MRKVGGCYVALGFCRVVLSRERTWSFYGVGFREFIFLFIRNSLNEFVRFYLLYFWWFIREEGSW